MNIIEPSDYLKPGIDLGVSLPPNCALFVEKWNDYIHIEKKPVSKNKIIKFPRDQLEDFPPNSGSYELSDDPASPVVVICPRQDKSLQSHAVHFGACASGPCQTPSKGIELLITNTISNPNIRYIILAGKDSGHLSGDVIRCLVEHGIDEKTRRVKKTRCPTYPYLKNLPLEYIEIFRKQVKVIDLLGCEDPAVLGIIIRLCLQEPGNAFNVKIPFKNQELVLYDCGAFSSEKIVFNYSIMEMSEGFVDSPSPIGTTLHCLSVSQAYSMLEKHIFGHGSWVLQESSRQVLDIISTQAIIYDTKNELIPDDYYPADWTTSMKLTEDYLNKYSIWCYLFPLSNVRFDTETEKTVPYIPDIKNLGYTYGTRATAYGVEQAKGSEIDDIIEIVKRYQDKYYDNAPSFQVVSRFYGELADVQEKSYNSLLAMAKGASQNIKDEITGSYRLYSQYQIPKSDFSQCSTSNLHFQLQIPEIDLKGKPQEMHNPCFCLYELYPRKLHYGVVKRDNLTLRLPLPELVDAEDYFPDDAKLEFGWLLYPCFFLRANDLLAFPSNAYAGIKIAEYISDYIAGETNTDAPTGAYTHHAGSLHICDYAIPKNTLKAILDKHNRMRL